MIDNPRKIPFTDEESIATQNLSKSVQATNRPDTFAAMKEYFSDFDYGPCYPRSEISIDRRKHETHRGRILFDMNRRRDKLHTRAAAVGSWLEPGA